MFFVFCLIKFKYKEFHPIKTNLFSIIFKCVNNKLHLGFRGFEGIKMKFVKRCKSVVYDSGREMSLQAFANKALSRIGVKRSIVEILRVFSEN